MEISVKGLLQEGVVKLSIVVPEDRDHTHLWNGGTERSATIEIPPWKLKEIIADLQECDAIMNGPVAHIGKRHSWRT